MMQIEDYDYCLSTDRLTIFTESGQTDFSLADFFDFIAPSKGAWNEAETKSLIIEGPVQYRPYRCVDGEVDWIEYPARCERYTWEAWINEHRGDMLDYVQQYYIISK